MIIKDLVIFLWWVFLGSVLLWIMSHILMAIIKTLFCDIQMKLYKVWCKKIKHCVGGEETKKSSDKIKNRKNFNGQSF